MFVAALVFSVLALIAVVLMEERPLHGAKEMPPSEPAEEVEATHAIAAVGNRRHLFPDPFQHRC